VVLQTQIFFLVNRFSPTWKNVDLWYKTTFFSSQPLFSNQISRTTFLEPLFYNFLEKWLQNKWSSAFLTCSLRFLRSNKLDQMEFKLEKKYWDLETCRKSLKKNILHTWPSVIYLDDTVCLKMLFSLCWIICFEKCRHRHYGRNFQILPKNHEVFFYRCRR